MFKLKEGSRRDGGKSPTSNAANVTMFWRGFGSASDLLSELAGSSEEIADVHDRLRGFEESLVRTSHGDDSFSSTNSQSPRHR